MSLFFSQQCIAVFTVLLRNTCLNESGEAAAGAVSTLSTLYVASYCIFSVVYHVTALLSTVSTQM